MKDARGIERGKCSRCHYCSEYNTDGSKILKCTNCRCPPGAHIAKGAGPKTEPEGSDSSPHAEPPLFTRVEKAAGGFSIPQKGAGSTESGSYIQAPSYCGKTCPVSGCKNLVDFDPNSGREAGACTSHSHAAMLPDSAMPPYCSYDGLEVEDLESSDPQHPPGQVVQQAKTFQQSPSQQHNFSYFHPMAAGLPMSPLYPQVPVLPSGVRKCALQECFNSCHVDESGHVHECCGFTHAMEHQRRLAILQANKKMVKGVTHCLLPECNNLTWPFENYCGKTHANIGKKRGLKRPKAQGGVTDSSLCIIPGCGKPKCVEGSVTHPYCGKTHAELGKKKGVLPTSQPAATQVQQPSVVVPTAPKDKSLCIIPECTQPKMVEGSVVHPYCSKSHADLGTQRGILPTADNVQDQCELPGCTRPKLVEGTTVHEYCSKNHANQDAPNRDAKLLTSMSEVQKFLNKYPSLNVLKMDENDHAKPGGVLFNKFKKATLALPKGQRQTCLAFHGTSESNIASIFANGYDPKRRRGQHYGTGEYFAASPDTAKGYCNMGGKKLILNELLLGQTGVHHTKHGDVIVMKNPEHDLPRFVITFQ